MRDKDHIDFELLKQKIVAVMQQSQPGINPVISEWKGQEITDFQEDLRIRVNSNISEKWFYTHMKSPRSTFPRIDMLNILSKYAGYANWDDFLFKTGKETLLAEEPLINPIRKVGINRYFILVPMLTLIIMVVLFGLFKLFNVREYRFCFVDQDTREPIVNNRVEIILLPEGESPVHFLAAKEGCFLLKTDKSRIRMVVSSPYYHTDTLVRIVRKLDREEIITLKTNDYALMIHYFSMMKVDDWEKRRKRLDEMIDNDAMICQVINSREATGMALYNKEEFIDLLTVPTSRLKNIEILGMQERKNRITTLRFRINEKKR